MKIQIKYKRSFIGMLIAILTTLVGGIIMDLIRESHLLSIHPTHFIEKSVDSSGIQKISVDTLTYASTKKLNASAFYWEHMYFKPLKKNSWNVIVCSLPENSDLAKVAFSNLRNQFPQFYFRLALTRSQDSTAKNYYAIFLGNGLSKGEARKIIDIAKQFELASDVYMVKQEFTSGKVYK